LGRLDPSYAQAVVVTGAVVAVGLCLQITLSLFNLFHRLGQCLLVLVLVAACVGGYVVKERVIDPHLLKESVSATVND
jgi:hypothetical protein